MPRLKTIDLEAAVMQILDRYNLEVNDEMKEAVKEATKAGVKKVKENSGMFGGTKYASGWTSRLEEGRISAQGIIYNSKVPGLPHLLEHGHALRGGGRWDPDQPHIAPVEQELERIFTQELEAGLR